MRRKRKKCRGEQQVTPQHGFSISGAYRIWQYLAINLNRVKGRKSSFPRHFSRGSNSRENLQICDNGKESLPKLFHQVLGERKFLCWISKLKFQLKVWLKLMWIQKFPLRFPCRGDGSRADSVEKCWNSRENLFSICHHPASWLWERSSPMRKNETLFNWKYTHLKVHHHLVGSEKGARVCGEETSASALRTVKWVEHMQQQKMKHQKSLKFIRIRSWLLRFILAKKTFYFKTRTSTETWERLTSVTWRGREREKGREHHPARL